MVKEKPLIVICGQTASGKTSLAIELAEAYGGEIICADSRTIYKGMDIGTAKPTIEERKKVPHWGLDLVTPGEYFTVVDFKKYAEKKIKEIRSRGKVPFLVGGTGLYIDSILFDYRFGKELDVAKRTSLNLMSLDELHNLCKQNDIQLPENSHNKRYVVREIEKSGETVSKNSTPIKNTIIVGITTDKEVLLDRIDKRIENMINNGVIAEANGLGDKFGWDNEALKSNVYKIVKLYNTGQIGFEDIKRHNAVLDWRLAKRQLTWLKRNMFIKWFDYNNARSYLFSLLAKLV
ncbi:MAG: tRNA (adenosine(37)-N6)-dimethylallyltransferase MiaA [Candidatus Saccharibacteria bacterium]